MSALPEYFMAAIGFKLPHLAVHLPYKYYEMYKGKSAAWALTKKELRFPFSSPTLAYRCCADPEFHFMNNEGAERWTKSITLSDINVVFTDKMHDELMMGYCGAITFVDKQVSIIESLFNYVNRDTNAKHEFVIKYVFSSWVEY